MFLVRRICKVERKDIWKVASMLYQICNEYEEQGRTEATIYVMGFSTPSETFGVCAEWKQESLKAINFPKVPDKIKSSLSAELMDIVDSYEIEFHEVVTKEKLVDRGLI